MFKREIIPLLFIVLSGFIILSCKPVNNPSDDPDNPQTDGNVENPEPTPEEKKAFYTVEHYLQNIDGLTYDKEKSEKKESVAGKKTEASALTFEGFTVQDFSQADIQEDGKSVVKIYYNRNQITLSFDANGGTCSVTELKGLYGQSISSPTATKTNFDFAKWVDSNNNDLPETFPAVNKSYTALWTVNGVGFSISIKNEGNVKIKFSYSEGVINFSTEEAYSTYKWSLKGTSVTSTAATFDVSTAVLIEDYYEIELTVNGKFLETVQIFVDKTAPQEVKNLSCTKIGNSLTLNYSLPSDADFKNVKICFTDSDGSQKTSFSTNSSWTLSPIDSGFTYSFTIKTVDSNGNESSGISVKYYPVLSIASDGTYDLSSASRFSSKLKGVSFKSGKLFSLKFKFTEENTAPVSSMYIRTGSQQFLYYGVKSGTLTALSGMWDGWYEYSGTFTADSEYLSIEFNKEEDSPFTDSTKIYVADFVYDGANLNFSSITLSKNSDITPSKTIVDFSSVAE